MPISLPSLLEKIQHSCNLKQLLAATRRIQEKYEEQGIPLSGKAEHLAYAFYRMPATYASTLTVLQYLKEVVPSFLPKNQLDLGSGPGTAMLAATHLFDGIRAVGLERSEEFMNIFHSLKDILPENLQNLSMRKYDLSTADIADTYDLLTTSYSLGEWPKQTRQKWLHWAKEHSSIVCIVEPGTPEGWQTILECRELLLSLGAKILAPCPHSLSCPFLTTKEWCHFSVRVQRSSLHRRLKGGDLAYEDEKFSYLIALCNDSIPTSVPAARIVHTPCHRSGHTHLCLCTQEGLIKNIVVSKKHGAVYQQIRRGKWGDALPVMP
jgi:ribosomal protein RSM22 (predicted rRNA methylase)